jgi:hypothetical protein
VTQKFHKKTEPTVEAKEASPEVAEVDPVMEARDADEGALDTPHEEAKSVKEEANEDSPVKEEARDAQPEEKREETPAEEDDAESVKTEPSNDEDATPAEEAAAEEVDPALSTVKEEEEESDKEEPVAASSRDEAKGDVVDKDMNVDTVAVSEEEATLETKDTMDSNVKACMTPVMRATDFCGINIRSCFE